MDNPSSSTVSSPSKPRRGLLNLILIVGIIAALALFIWAEQQRRSTESRLEQTETQLEEIRRSTQRGGEELAQEVLSKVRSHMVISEEPVPTVATIVDIDRLRESSDFYTPAENGDHLIITEKRAILYDPETDTILDVVPVRINTADEADSSPSPTSAANRTTPSPPASPADAGDSPDTETGSQ